MHSGARQISRQLSLISRITPMARRRVGDLCQGFGIFRFGADNCIRTLPREREAAEGYDYSNHPRSLVLPVNVSGRSIPAAPVGLVLR